MNGRRKLGLQLGVLLLGALVVALLGVPLNDVGIGLGVAVVTLMLLRGQS